MKCWIATCIVLWFTWMGHTVVVTDVFTCNDFCNQYVNLTIQEITVFRTSAKQCNMTAIKTIPFPKDLSTTIPAPSPSWLNSSWYIYEKVDKHLSIALNLTWIQNGNGFESVDGYFLAIARTRSSLTFKRVFSFEAKSSAEKVIFNYACFGTADKEDIKPGYCYSLSLQSMPLYHKNSDPQLAWNILCIPDCENEHIGKTWHCLKKDKFDDANDGDYDYDVDFDKEIEETGNQTLMNYDPDQRLKPTKAIFIVLMVFAAILVLSAPLFVFIWHKCKKNAGVVSKSILMVISTLNSEEESIYCEIASCLATILKDCGEVDVSFNLWVMTSIHDITKWMHEELDKCNHVILVCTPLGKSSYATAGTSSSKTLCLDPFVLGITKCLMEEQNNFFGRTKTHKFSSIYFEQNPQISVPEVLLENSIKSYRIINAFDTFFNKVTGKDSSAVSSHLRKRLQSAISHLKLDDDHSVNQSVVTACKLLVHYSNAIQCNESKTSVAASGSGSLSNLSGNNLKISTPYNNATAVVDESDVLLCKIDLV